MAPGLSNGTLRGYGRTADIFSWGNGRVLKLYHAGWDDSVVQLEARISREVHEIGLPVPAVGDVLSMDGRHGIVFERVDGPSMLQAFSRKPWTIVSSLRTFTELHVAMHRQTVSGLPSQRERLAQQIQQASAVPEDVMMAALEALGRLPDGDRLCHSDYHPDNVLVTPRGPFIIDWATASQGNPLADAALTALLFQLGEPPPGRVDRFMMQAGRAIARAGYLRQYRKLTAVRQTEIDAWLLPIAAARLGHGIKAEESQLLKVIESALQ